MPKKATINTNWFMVYQQSSGVMLPSIQRVRDVLTDLEPKTFAFQLEKGESGRLHYQIFIELEKAMSQTQLREAMKSKLWRKDESTGLREYCGGCLTVQPAHSSEASFLYSSKEETRIGETQLFPPQSDLVSMYKPRMFTGDRLPTYEELYPWQRHYIDQLAEEPDPRKIDFIIDEGGKKGKSDMRILLSLRYHARYVPVGRDAAQVVSALISCADAKTYVFDIPRNEHRWEEILHIMEELKSGHIASTFRGTMREKLMNRPHIICLSNEFPPIKHLSKDMFNLATIHPESLARVAIDTDDILVKQMSVEYNNNKAEQQSHFIDRDPEGLYPTEEA